ncbi:MAG: hypothetical protein KDB69_01985, partial [Acidimicrobiia bacterium]|nr:hypothetical protein [Acidimicrobiia bacterium]
MKPFEDVIGHEAVLDLLRSELADPAQAYLFVGPANVGKAKVAREFAAAMVADGDDDAYRRAATGAHPDVIVVAPEGRTAITVEQARSVVSSAVLSPLEAARKVFLFEEASMLNEGAANALLKTIEEPIGSTAFVLVADAETDLPITIASRCRTVVFGRVATDEVEDGLVRIVGLDADDAAEAARIAGGRPGLALSLATEPLTVAFRDAWLAVPEGLTDHPGDAYRLAGSVLDATDPLLASIRNRQEHDLRALYGSEEPPKSVMERQQREIKRTEDALAVTGLELLASFYRDTAAAQLGAPVQNPDVTVS